MSKWKVPVQSLIDHIKTAVDVDPWAKEMAEELLKEREAVKPIKSKLSFTHGFNWDIWDCGCCGNQLRSFAKYCDQCGKVVKWDE